MVLAALGGWADARPHHQYSTKSRGLFCACKDGRAQEKSQLRSVNTFRAFSKQIDMRSDG